jgi:hypothetical protein
LVDLIISKEQKTSEFRQAWIDGLRIEVSALISHANALGASRALLCTSDEELRSEERSDLIGLNGAWARMRLRLNPAELSSIALLGSLEDLENLFDQNRVKIDLKQLFIIERNLIEECNAVLRFEWKRVKRGELGFQIAKWVALAVIIVFACLAVSLLLSGESSGNAPSAASAYSCSGLAASHNLERGPLQPVHPIVSQPVV